MFARCTAHLPPTCANRTIGHKISAFTGGAREYHRILLNTDDRRHASALPRAWLILPFTRAFSARCCGNRAS
jgi:hypothetical protein